MSLIVIQVIQVKVKNLIVLSSLGEVVKMEKRVDESLLGGMTVIIGDKFIDMSLAKKIKKYTDLISQPI